MKYICSLCKYITDDISDPIYRCPRCGIGKKSFKIYYEIEEKDKKVYISKNNLCINRINEKCINCGMCTKTCNNVTNLNLDPTCHECVGCGNCLLTCPTGAISPKYNYKEVMSLLSTNKTLICYTAPSVKSSLGEAFGLYENTEGKLVTSLKELGFKYVFDTSFGADICVIEESKELISRHNKNTLLPMFNSCCPAWVSFLSLKYPSLVPNLSTVKSPTNIMDSIVKSYFAEELNLNPNDIITVSIVPCTAKKSSDTSNYTLTTTELIMMVKESGIDFTSLKDSTYDNLIKGSSSGIVFGKNGGLTESLFRCVNYRLTSKNNSNLIIKDIKITESITTKDIIINNYTFKVATIYGLKNASTILDKIINKEEHYDFIEVMACPNGCVGGPGNPLVNINKLPECRNNRSKILLNIDNNTSNKYPYNNKEVQKLYNKFLTKEKISTLLHTNHLKNNNNVVK